MKIFLFLACIVPFFVGAQTPKKTRILFILDASNSMNVSWGTQTRMQAAKEVLLSELETLRGVPNTEVALRIYGHQTMITAEEQDCNDTRLEVPFGLNNLDVIKAKINGVQAKGATPIARSLEAAASDFPDTSSKNVIILITDGLESCDNDPCVVAKKLKDKGVKVTPFVIGIGMDLSYLDKFKCIGSYSDAEDKESFRRVFRTIINKVIVQTSVQINLNDGNGKPLETDVSIFVYESGTNNIKYTLTHTLNRAGKPDTLFFSPKFNYDILVQTIPPVTKNQIQLVKNTHNIISIDVPQGMLKLTSTNSLKVHGFEMRVMKKGSTKTLHEQNYGEVNKYIAGKYEVEIFTIPRIYKTIDVLANKMNEIDIEAPALLEMSNSKAIVGQLFYQEYKGEWTWVYNFSSDQLKQNVWLQPGNYKIMYRPKDMKSTAYSSEKTFQMVSNKNYILTLN